MKRWQQQGAASRGQTQARRLPWELRLAGPGGIEQGPSLAGDDGRERTASKQVNDSTASQGRLHLMSAPTRPRSRAHPTAARTRARRQSSSSSVGFRLEHRVAAMIVGRPRPTGGGVTNAGSAIVGGVLCETHAMELVASSVPGVIVAIVGAFLSYRFAGRAALEAETRLVRREAASDLCAPLRDLRTMTRALGRVETPRDDVSSAAVAWFEAFDRKVHLLPSGWSHLGRSVRAAILTVFGGVALTDIRPDQRESDLADPDFEWQDFADDYISYAINAVSRWGDGQRVPKRLEDFDTWLSATGRRDAIK